LEVPVTAFLAQRLSWSQVSRSAIESTALNIKPAGSRAAVGSMSGVDSGLDGKGLF
jgi:hypothetical protein